MPASQASARRPHDARRLQFQPVAPPRGDEKLLRVEPRGKRTRRADEQPLLVGAVHKPADLRAQFLFAVGRRGRRQLARLRQHALDQPVGRQRPDLAEGRRLHQRLRHELQRLEPLERVLQIPPADHDAVVLQHHAVRARRKRLRDVPAQLIAARAGVGRVGHLAADRMGQHLHPGVRQHAGRC